MTRSLTVPFQARRMLPLMLASVVLGAALGCGEDGESPTGPDAVEAPQLATTAATLVFRSISAGDGHTCGVTTINVAYCWGNNSYGQLGVGSAVFRDQLFPVPVAGGLRFRNVSVGPTHSCGVTTDDRAYCWGFGMLGDGSAANYHYTPTAVAGGLHFRQVRAGINHTCGITTDATAYCWGRNLDGQLGNYSHKNRSAPVKVGGGLHWRWVSPGEHHTCGVTTGSKPYCWGRNTMGQLGVSGVTSKSSPLAVGGGLSVQDIEAGHNHTCALTTVSGIYCWGNNSTGQLGDGMQTLSDPRPDPVAGNRTYARVSAAYFYTCSITTAGRGVCWGSNPRGELGNGTTTDRLTPTLMAEGLIFAQIGVGDSHGCAVTPEGRAYCWGENRLGQLGDGTTTQRLSPVPVAGPI